MYADLHCDTLYKCFTEKTSLDDPSLHITSHALTKYVPCIQTFAHYIPENVRNKYTYFQKMLENSLEILHNTDSVVRFQKYGDVLTAEEQHKTLAVLSVENGDFFGDDTEENVKRVNYLEKNNIRFLSLCYNNGSPLCGGAFTDGRLTRRGREVVSLLASRGITVDVSHLNNVSVSDVLDCGVRTAATHSNCMSLCNNPRNLTDENIYRLCENGSLIGVNLYSPFLTDSGYATLADVRAHVLHIISLGGENSIALGADLDGCDRLPHGINGVADIQKIYGHIPVIREKIYNNVRNYLLS